MTAQSQNSVLFALSELQQIEAQRIAEEAAQQAEARRRAEEADRRERQARIEAEEHRQRVAEAEARLRVAEELRVGEVQKQAGQLEHELRVVRAERSLLADSLTRFEQTPAPSPYRPLYALSAFAVVLIGGVTLATSLLSRYPDPPRRQVVERAPVVSPAIDPKLADQMAALEARLNKILADRPTEKPAAHPTATGKRPSPHSSRPSERPNLNAEQCENDPLGCLHLR